MQTNMYTLTPLGTKPLKPPGGGYMLMLWLVNGLLALRSQKYMYVCACLSHHTILVWIPLVQHTNSVAEISIKIVNMSKAISLLCV